MWLTLGTNYLKSNNHLSCQEFPHVLLKPRIPVFIRADHWIILSCKNPLHILTHNFFQDPYLIIIQERRVLQSNFLPSCSPAKIMCDFFNYVIWSFSLCNFFHSCGPKYCIYCPVLRYPHIVKLFHGTRKIRDLFNLIHMLLHWRQEQNIESQMVANIAPISFALNILMNAIFILVYCSFKAFELCHVILIIIALQLLHQAVWISIW
jgi:hypothetical protein